MDTSRAIRLPQAVNEDQRPCHFTVWSAGKIANSTETTGRRALEQLSSLDQLLSGNEV